MLAAGVLQSPKMLQLSGIGPEQLLKSNGISVRIDNSHVGENLQDHVVCSIGYEAKDSVPTLDDLIRQDPKSIEAAMGEYMQTRTGPMISTGVASYAYLPVNEFLSEAGQMSLEKLLDQYAPESPEASNSSASLYYDIMKSTLRSKEDASGSFLTIATQIILPCAPDSELLIRPVAGKFITLGTMLSQPLSRGRVQIVSANASDAPLIDPNYLSHPLDVEIFARHMRYLDTIASTAPFKSLLKEGGRLLDPKARFASLDEAKDYLRASSISMWHPAGTCSMLPEEKGGVVDSSLLVYGTRNLRVVDASVFPLIPRANIQSTVYAVAERAADSIKARHGL